VLGHDRADDQLERVVDGCAYDSTSAYIAAFKGLFGFTPGELRL